MFMGDFNGWVSNRARGEVKGAFRVDVENQNGEKIVDFCAEKMRVINTFFHHWDIHKYIWNSLKGNVTQNRRNRIDLNY